ncbi:hypothetical protein HORM4_1110017 [Vibrio harveyi]|nr:hypothetical protein HORM4_1110017 [Vibrio harveyi]
MTFSTNLNKVNNGRVCKLFLWWFGISWLIEELVLYVANKDI